LISPDTAGTTHFQLSANSVWGALRGLESFSQLVEYDMSRNIYFIKYTQILIQDAPRFPWRGFMIDTSRHFLTVKVIKTLLDGMAWNKFNLLHWHIVDAESFPFQVPKYPQLHLSGAYHMNASYSLSELKDIVEYAYLRGIRIMPEFDCPGHTDSWGKFYDIIAKCPGYISRSPFRNNIALNPGKELVFPIIEAIIDEAVKAFPEKFYHFGADEVRKPCWEEDQHLREFMRRMGFGDDFEMLLDYFERNLEPKYRRHNKVLVAWQELLLNQNKYPVPKDTIIHTWQKQSDIIEVVKRGYQTIMSAGWYLDYQIPTGGQRRHLWQYTWIDYYLNDPYAGQNFNETERKLIKGGVACAWGEVIDDEVYEERIWPRVSAIAERLWSPQNVNNVKLAEKRLSKFRCDTLVKRNIRATPITTPDFCRYSIFKQLLANKQQQQQLNSK